MQNRRRGWTTRTLLQLLVVVSLVSLMGIIVHMNLSFLGTERAHTIEMREPQRIRRVAETTTPPVTTTAAPTTTTPPVTTTAAPTTTTPPVTTTVAPTTTTPPVTTTAAPTTTTPPVTTTAAPTTTTPPVTTTAAPTTTTTLSTAAVTTTTDLSTRRIVVLISNYRDSIRCAETLISIFTKAQHPDLVSVSIYDQLRFDLDEKPCMDVYCSNVGEDNCNRAQRLARNDTLDANQATGPTFARYQTEKGIDLAKHAFVLAIDSHMVFIRNWDTDIIAQWDSIENPKAVITVYPDPTTNMLKDDAIPTTTAKMCHGRIETEDADSMIQYGAATNIPSPKVPQLMSQFAGGFSFATAECALHVRNDPYTPYLFHGEEYSKAARLFTHGYDMYYPTHMVVYHWFEVRKYVWDEDWGRKWKLQQPAKRRIRAALGLPVTAEDYDKTDFDKFRVGTKRTMNQFIDFSGINPLAPYKGTSSDQFVNCGEHTYVPVAE